MRVPTDEHKDAVKAMYEIKMEMAIRNGDEDIIFLLDVWLGDWLYCISRCPNCGEE